MSSNFDPKTAPASVFPAHSGDAYEQVMGRWSRRLAPPLIRFGGLADGDRVLDVGCGTGSLTFALPEMAKIAAVTGIDQSKFYVDYAHARNTDPVYCWWRLKPLGASNTGADGPLLSVLCRLLRPFLVPVKRTGPFWRA